MAVDKDHPNPRQKFHDFMSSGRDPVKLAQLMEDLHTVAAFDSGAAFDETCAVVSKIAATVDPKGALEAARVEVEKKPAKEAAAEAGELVAAASKKN